MKKKYKVFGIIFLMFLMGIDTANAQRDPIKWPFDKYSIWNVPIHNNAVYVASGLTQVNSNSFNVDEEVVIMRPIEPLMKVETNYADWSGGDRCPDQGPTMFSAPIPANYIYDNSVWQGSTPNAGAAILNEDGNRIMQTQPFAKCDTTYATSHYLWDENVCLLKGECIYGAHGGSALSSIGGTIRVGEFTSGAINHVLKINVWGKHFLSSSGNGYRWPSNHADGGYHQPNSFNYYGGSVPQMVMGSLLAIHKNIDINLLGLETAPGLIIAKTMQDYGAYIVDNTGWNNFAFVTETGPEGIVRNEFHNLYGFGIEAWDNLNNTAWGRDMKRILTSLYVIDNNDASNISGGPTESTNRRASFAPDIAGEPIPGRVQVENYNAMSGISVSTAEDVDGDLHVGNIDTGDWMDYNVEVGTSGTYNINYRVTGYYSGGKLQLQEGGTEIHTVNIPNTGGWQNWTTVSNLAYLSQGTHRLRIYVLVAGWNINWFEGVSSNPNQSPACNITAPNNNDIYTAPASITIKANTSDSDGSVIKVQFYNGATLLHTDTKYPYYYNWANVAAGTYNITAIATDNAGAQTTSSNVTILVNTSDTDIKDIIETRELTLYPNPNYGMVYINSEKDVESIKVYSVTGQLVLESKGSIKSLDLSSLSFGIYYLKITTAEKTIAIRKIIFIRE
ncbi:MAG: hypothetical protein FD155_2388 [Bacteroidetes bacterium]|nr:MAG: hypothetical protein FD155_2388 [Bacteroidota bacterium]